MTGIFQKHGALLILLAFLSVFSLRFVNLSGKGFFSYDEAYYSLEARTPAQALSWLRENLSQLRNGEKGISDLKEYLKQHGAVFPLGTAKPSFLFALSVFYFIFGNHDLTAFLFSVFWSAALLGAVFLLSKQLWGNEAAVLSAFAALISVEHFYFSRSGYPQTMAAFFLCASLYLIARRRFLSGGAAFSLALTSHYCVLFSLIPALLWFALYKREKLLAFLAGFIIPLVIIEALFRIEYLLLKPWLSDVSFFTYAQHFARQILWVSPNKTSFFSHDFLLVPKMLFSSEGILLGAAALSAVTVFAAKFSKLSVEEKLVVFTGAGGLLLWVINPGFTASRAVFPSWMLILALCGYAFSLIRIKALLLTLLLALGVFSAYRHLSLSAVSSNYKEAAAWVSENGGEGVIEIFNWPIYQFYLNKTVSANSDRIQSLPDLKSFQEAGTRFLSIDYTSAFWDRETWGFADDIMASRQPVKTVKTGLFKYPWIIYQIVPTETEQKRLNEAPEYKKDINIYDLDAYFSAKS